MKLTNEQVASLKSYMPPVGKSWFFCLCGEVLETEIEEMYDLRENHLINECKNYKEYEKIRAL